MGWIFMNWTEQFAERTQQMKRTAVRELLKVTSQPEMISFAGGLPAAELFPMDRVAQAVSGVLGRLGGKTLQYAETEGIPQLRDWIADRFSRGALRVRRDNVLITSGAQQALDLIGRVLLNPGDRVVVENPTYLALLSAWRPYGAKFLPVPSDALGLQVAELPAMLSQQSPKLIYLAPNFQNPQGTTLAADRRHKLITLLREHPVAVVEDNPYGDLRYDGEPVPDLLELEAGQLATTTHAAATSPNDSRILYCGTFSKTLMPGLRVGWIIAPEPVIERMVQAKQAIDLHSSTLSQYTVLELVQSGFLTDFLPVLRGTYAQRRDLMLEALAEHFPDGASWTRPAGGMFLMATLPSNLDTTALLPASIRQKVVYVPGEEFHLNGMGRNTMRLNFSNAKPAQIEEGIRRLGKLVRGNSKT